MSKYYFSVGAIFKNESMIIKEWIEHYLVRGVEHFYLIDDYSDDNSVEILKPYIDKNIVTLFKNTLGIFRGRQNTAYNTFFPSIYHETSWLGIFDIDEFCYSPKKLSISNILREYENFAQIQINWLCFGSNGHTKHPSNIVENFTKRGKQGIYVTLDTPLGVQSCDTRGTKTIINTKFKLHGFGMHGSSIEGKVINLSWEGRGDDPILLLNHYWVLSKEYWENIKMKRGIKKFFQK